MASDIWQMTIQRAREENRCRHMGYSFRLTARVLLYAPSHRQDCTYHGLCYTSRGALAKTRKSSMGPPHEGSIQRPIAPWANAPTTEVHLVPACIKTCSASLILMVACLCVKCCTASYQSEAFRNDSEWLNECLTVPQHKQSLTIGCQTNNIYIICHPIETKYTINLVSCTLKIG